MGFSIGWASPPSVELLLAEIFHGKQLVTKMSMLMKHLNIKSKTAALDTGVKTKIKKKRQ